MIESILQQRDRLTAYRRSKARPATRKDPRLCDSDGACERRPWTTLSDAEKDLILARKAGRKR